MHVVWQTNQEEGFGQAIYYVRSTDGGAEWTLPLKVANRDAGEYGVSFASIASVGTSELHMVYIDGPWHIGRYHRTSRDSGNTWDEPKQVFTDFEGINGYPLLLVDGSGQLNLVITWRTRTQVGGSYYALWMGTYWSSMEPVALETEQTGPGAHWTAATVRLGNDIHVLWNTNFSSQAGEIWHTHGFIPSVAATRALPVPPPTQMTTTAPAAVASTFEKANQAASQVVLAEPPLAAITASTVPQGDADLALPLGVGSALFLVLGFVALQRWRARVSGW
jgi:hypothetical protein